MIRTELTLRLPNSPGALAEICRLLSDEHVNIIALSLEATGRLRLVVDNPVRALGALAARHHQVSQLDVLFVAAGNKAGDLEPILSLVSSAGVNINYAYGSGADGAGTAAVVIGVDDAMRASSVAGV
jgi:hypothetical protein